MKTFVILIHFFLAAAWLPVVAGIESCPDISSASYLSDYEVKFSDDLGKEFCYLERQGPFHVMYHGYYRERDQHQDLGSALNSVLTEFYRDLTDDFLNNEVSSEQLALPRWVQSPPPGHVVQTSGWYIQDTPFMKWTIAHFSSQYNSTSVERIELSFYDGRVSSIVAFDRSGHVTDEYFLTTLGDGFHVRYSQLGLDPYTIGAWGRIREAWNRLYSDRAYSTAYGKRELALRIYDTFKTESPLSTSVGLSQLFNSL